MGVGDVRTPNEWVTQTGGRFVGLELPELMPDTGQGSPISVDWDKSPIVCRG